MDSDDDGLRLSHMRDYAREAVTLLSGHHRADLDTDRLLQLAMAELLHIISEAANRVSPAGRSGYAAIPWHDILAFRDRVQDYSFRIDNDFLWQTARHDLPVLISGLEGTAPGRGREP